MAEITKYNDYDLIFALVCVNHKYKGFKSEICLLYEDEIKQLVDINSVTEQRINVYLEKGKSFRVDGSISKFYQHLTISKNRIDSFEIPK